MARLHEYQGKELLKQQGIHIPRGAVVSTPQGAASAAEEIGLPVVIKAQVWTTGRAGMGGIRFADTAEEARAAAAEILSMQVENFPVECVLVEEKLNIEREFYVGLIVDDGARRPVILFSSVGGTGVEDVAGQHPDKVVRQPIDVVEGLHAYQARNIVRRAGISGRLQVQLADVLEKLYLVARRVEARAAEINPLVLTVGGEIVAADCRITVDDYAVYRHPELGIDIARELNHPPTELERIAYRVEENDYRGTFYFIQLAQGFQAGEGYIGFHGAGGGGSMMSMDAVTRWGFKVANFCDTSGNPPASKFYRAAKIILSQPNIDGYFESGSGVASQEQFHIARALVKAFREENLSIPAVLRLGGNGEDLAAHIIRAYTRDLPAPVEVYQKDDSADYCAQRLRRLVDAHQSRSREQDEARSSPPDDAPPQQPYTFDIRTGTITFDHAQCVNCESKICIQACVPQILKLENDLPVLAITREEAQRGGCIECLACEVECWFHGRNGAKIELPIEGLDEYRQKTRRASEAVESVASVER
ncbi:MAG: succinyl-CoA synthetase subunit beta [Acidobacteria bacterium]|nr:MAG: succinyl-CoA synthetase subunit beta [Acidobacteriota bacterium]